MQNEQRVIISGKVSRRSDDEPPTLLVESVKTVDNSNIFTITLLDDFKFEEIVFMKNILCKFPGSDPVTFKMKDMSGDVKVLVSSMFWVSSSNELVNILNKQFEGRLKIDIRSLDSNEKEEQAA